MGRRHRQTRSASGGGSLLRVIWGGGYETVRLHASEISWRRRTVFCVSFSTVANIPGMAYLLSEYIYGNLALN